METSGKPGLVRSMRRWDLVGVVLNGVIGAGIFGLGWGLSGFCPGPSLANLGAFRVAALVFVPSMTVGMLLAQRFLHADR